MENNKSYNPPLMFKQIISDTNLINIKNAKIINNNVLENIEYFKLSQ